MPHILFHRIAQIDSSQVRKLITDLGIKDQIDFRNVDSGTRDLALLKQRTGTAQTPTLITSEGVLLTKLNDILKFLRSLQPK